MSAKNIKLHKTNHLKAFLAIFIVFFLSVLPANAGEPPLTEDSEAIEVNLDNNEESGASDKVCSESEIEEDKIQETKAVEEDDWEPRYAVSTKYSKSRSGKTITWHLMYSKAAEIVPKLNELFSSESDVKITALESPNAILLQTEEKNNPTLNEIADVIRSLDIRPGQVLIDVLVVETTFSDKDIFDLEFKQILRDPLQIKKTMATISGDFGSIDLDPTGVKKNGLKAFALSNDKVKILINALQEKRNTEVVSSPHIITRNNKQAEFMMGQKVSLIDSVTPSESGATKNFKEVPVVTKLTVTPNINRSGQVRLAVDHIMDEVLEYDFTKGTAQISNRHLSTVAFLENGETLMLGGFIEDNSHSNDRKLPWLSKIPFLGKAFSNKDKRKEKKELLVFITPHIMYSAEDEHRLISKKAEKLSSRHKVKKLLNNRINVKSPVKTGEILLIPRSSRNWTYDFSTKMITDLCWQIPETIDHDSLQLTKAGAAPFAFGQSKRLKPPFFRTLLEPSEGFAFRKDFFVDDPNAFKNLCLKVASKNAAVIYLNGVLVDEDPMMKLVDGHDYNYWNRARKDVSPATLKKGKNTIVALLGNDKTTSGAFFDMELSGIP